MLFASVAFSNSTDSVNNGGNSGTGNGSGGSGSVVTKDDFVGTWTGTMDDDVSLSVTLNADGTVYAEDSTQGETTGLWTITNSGFIMWLNIGDEFPEEGVSGNLQSGKLVVNYMNNEISLTKS